MELRLVSSSLGSPRLLLTPSDPLPQPPDRIVDTCHHTGHKNTHPKSISPIVHINVTFNSGTQNQRENLQRVYQTQGIAKTTFMKAVDLDKCY